MFISRQVMILFYLPVAVAGFVVFGKHAENNVIENMDKNWLRTTTIVLITGHLLSAFNIILNPVFQGVEKIFKAPSKFSLKRVIVRGCVLAFVLFIAQSLPNFGPILSFIGGSTVSLSSFILPCIFYFLLCLKEEYNRLE
jgi:vesicular inhibitory amino acid transporter